MLPSVASADEAVAATSAAGSLPLPAVIAFVGGVLLLSLLVAVLSPPGSPCFGVLLTLPVVALQGDFDATVDAATDGGGFGGGSTTVSSAGDFIALTCCGGASDGVEGAGGW